MPWPIAIYSPDMQWKECEEIKNHNFVHSIKWPDLNWVSVQNNSEALLFELSCSVHPVYMYGVVLIQSNICRFQMGSLIPLNKNITSWLLSVETLEPTLFTEFSSIWPRMSTVLAKFLSTLITVTETNCLCVLYVFWD